jgi:hypothetical protein
MAAAAAMTERTAPPAAPEADQECRHRLLNWEIYSALGSREITFCLLVVGLCRWRRREKWCCLRPLLTRASQAASSRRLGHFVGDFLFDPLAQFGRAKGHRQAGQQVPGKGRLESSKWDSQEARTHTVAVTDRETPSCTPRLKAWPLSVQATTWWSCCCRRQFCCWSRLTKSTWKWKWEIVYVVFGIHPRCSPTVFSRMSAFSSLLLQFNHLPFTFSMLIHTSKFTHFCCNSECNNNSLSRSKQALMRARRFFSISGFFC